MKKIFYLLAILSLQYSCKQATNNTEEATTTAENTTSTTPPIADVNAANLEKGKVMESLTTGAGNYALYLPTAYDAGKSLPVIVFLDPHKHGAIPLNLYYQLAEKAGYILIGSNDSENGMDLATSFGISKALINEAVNKYHADTNRITVAGFSGGAKAAIYSAFYNPQVDALVYSGSALSADAPASPKKLDILGITGVDDMNYSELVLLKRQWDSKGINNYFIEGKGKHEWPSADLYKYAFIQPFAQIPASALAKIDAGREALLLKEQGIKNTYNTALVTQSAEWWETEIKKLEKESKTDKTGMSSRLIGHISLACYSLTGKYLYSTPGGDLQNADRALKIYKLADPPNKDRAYFQAVYYAKAKQADKVVPALEEALRLGYTGTGKMKVEDAFTGLNSPEVNNFLNSH